MLHGESPVENKVPSTLSLSEGVLPSVKDWKVGKSYDVHLKVKQIESHIEEYGPDKGKIRAVFHILKASSNPGKALEKRY